MDEKDLDVIARNSYFGDLANEHFTAIIRLARLGLMVEKVQTATDDKYKHTVTATIMRREIRLMALGIWAGRFAVEALQKGVRAEINAYGRQSELETECGKALASLPKEGA